MLAGVLEFLKFGPVKDKETGEEIQAWYCALCGYFSKHKKKTNVTDHLFYVHAEKEKLNCKFCRKEFKVRPKWKRHESRCAKMQQLYLPGQSGPLAKSLVPGGLPRKFI